ncbi:maleate cis-trans isomerase family protein [Zwartia panacis]|uniref:maleate cis-trans isomerase family protein n=1 Tax=Zwartia panacis TaxID=2683345 RepID=UPI0025B41DB7|nr:aspartate/glutamate racemase family protein [Zwartia panacis]MDN4016429.1 aspartate/glutamate racemase family protein [Zwartia panacis]
MLTPKRFPDYGERLRVGMILPNRNVVAEADVQAIIPDGVSFHTTRLKLHGTNPEDLRQMSEGAEEAAQLLGAAPIDVIVFHCTAVSTSDPAMGDQLVARIEKVANKKAIATSQGLVAALNTLHARRIVMLTPYQQSVNDSEVRFLNHFGFKVLDEIGLNLPSTVSTASITPQEWRDKALSMRRADADAYFLSCTNIRVLSIIDELEDLLQAPVITSNQAMLWHCLRQSNVADPIQGYGKLLREC